MASDEGLARMGGARQGRQNASFPYPTSVCGPSTTSSISRPLPASSVRKTFTSRLDLWANPLLDAATSGDDFDLRDLTPQGPCRFMSVSIRMTCIDYDRSCHSFFNQTIGLQNQ